MKQKPILLFLMAFISLTSMAQLGGLVNKVKSKITHRADVKTDKAIDKALDKAEGKPTAKTNVETNSNESTSTPSADQPVVKSFSKYDFIPGEQILYYDDFAMEATAELPAGWNTSGSGEVVTLESIPGKWLRVHAPFIYLSGNQQKLPENFTLEFDVVMQLKNNGWMYPTFTAGVFASNSEPNGSNEFLKNYKKNAAVLATIYPAEYKNSKIKIESYLTNNAYFSSDVKVFEELENHYHKPMHVAIQVQKERFRMWINETKAFDIPKAVPINQTMNQLLFQVGNTNYKDNQYAMYLGNIKTATGKADTRHRLEEEGKFSTTAILFDINSANIKPESGGVLKEIADVLKKSAGINVTIIGHTDSDGQDAENLLLSQKRAAAVKDALVNDFGISAERLDTDGKGETKPVADNKTKEGKASNRRVEFIKK
ncbi:MAG TPA: OmpA family protein [Ferruginibacter sp.]|nr:OmpA family protein [Ferruginibacter sp.]